MRFEIRPLQDRHWDAADKIFRRAFGTYLGLPDPMAFMGDGDMVKSRAAWSPLTAFGAFRDDVLMGSVLATRWGEFGFLGPLTVDPDHWGGGIATALAQAAIQVLDEQGASHTALFTFPDSVKHVGLYRKFGFRPGHLTALMRKSVQPAPSAPHWRRGSEMSEAELSDALASCRDVTQAVYPGLDLTGEIRAVLAQRTGDVVLCRADGGMVRGFAVCHAGAGSEAGSGAAYAKFAAIAPGQDSERDFMDLLAACEAFACENGAAILTAGINTARSPAYDSMFRAGFSSMIHGLAMHRGEGDGYDRPDCFVLDDLR